MTSTAPTLFVTLPYNVILDSDPRTFAAAAVAVRHGDIIDAATAYGLARRYAGTTPETAALRGLYPGQRAARHHLSRAIECLMWATLPEDKPHDVRARTVAAIALAGYVREHARP